MPRILNVGTTSTASPVVHCECTTGRSGRLTLDTHKIRLAGVQSSFGHCGVSGLDSSVIQPVVWSLLRGEENIWPGGS